MSANRLCGWSPALLLALAFCVVSCQTSPPTPPRQPLPNLANVPTEVAAEFQRSVAGWNSGNLDQFISIYAESATFALPDTILIGRNAIREFYAPNFESGVPRAELTLEQLDVEVLSPDAVLVRGIYRNSVQGRLNRRGTSTLVMRRIYGQWQIIHDHSS